MAVVFKLVFTQFKYMFDDLPLVWSNVCVLRFQDFVFFFLHISHNYEPAD